MPRNVALATALHGVHVVTLAPNVPGPVAAQRLRRLGARITKIEAPGGDPLAGFAPQWYAELHAHTVVVRLDLKVPADRAGLDWHLRNADVLLTSNRPSALARLGLGWEALHAQHPSLVHIAIVGELPPFEERAGHDLTYAADVGLLDPPHLPRTLLADLAGAERAAGAATALLLARAANGGLGAHAFVALRDAASDFAAPLAHGLTQSGGILGGATPGYGLYRCDDGWIALAALEPHFWDRLCGLFDVPSDTTSERIAEIFMTRTTASWERWAFAHDVPLVAVANR